MKLFLKILKIYCKINKKVIQRNIINNLAGEKLGQTQIASNARYKSAFDFPPSPSFFYTVIFDVRERRAYVNISLLSERIKKKKKKLTRHLQISESSLIPQTF